MLIWQDAGTDERGDQNADSFLAARSYWAIGPAQAGRWSCELIERDAQGDEVPTGGVYLGSHFTSEDAAKNAAQTYEEKHRG